MFNIHICHYHYYKKGDATLGNDLTVGENDNGIDYFYEIYKFQLNKLNLSFLFLFNTITR